MGPRGSQDLRSPSPIMAPEAVLELLTAIVLQTAGLQHALLYDFKRFGDWFCFACYQGNAFFTNRSTLIEYTHNLFEMEVWNIICEVYVKNIDSTKLREGQFPFVMVYKCFYYTTTGDGK